MKDYEHRKNDLKPEQDLGTGWEHFWSLTIGLGIIGFLIGVFGNGGSFLTGVEVGAAFVAGPLAVWVLGGLFRFRS